MSEFKKAKEEETHNRASSSDLVYDAEATKQHRGEEYVNRLKEIDRRTSVKDSGPGGIGLEADAMESLYMTTTKDGEFQRIVRETQMVPTIHGYKYCLLNKANHRLNPAGRHAAVRCLGFFSTKEEARAHLLDCAEAQDVEISTLADRLGDIHIAEVGKWVLVPKTKERDRDLEYTMTKIDAVVSVHVKERIQATKDFSVSKTSGGPGKTGVSLEKQRERKQKNAREKMKRKKKQFDAKRGKTSSSNSSTASRIKSATGAEAAAAAVEEKKFTRKVPRSMEVRNQRHMVIATLKDFTEPVLRLKDSPEPVVIFYDAFDRLEDAQKYIEDSLKDYVTIVDLDVVDLYEWIFVESMNPDLLPPEAEKWRNEEQTAIMRHRKVEQRTLEEEKLKQQNRKLVPLDAANENSSSSSDGSQGQAPHEIVSDPATLGGDVIFYDAKPIEDMARQMRTDQDQKTGTASHARSLLPIAKMNEEEGEEGRRKIE